MYSSFNKVQVEGVVKEVNLVLVDDVKKNLVSGWDAKTRTFANRLDGWTGKGYKLNKFGNPALIVETEAGVNIKVELKDVNFGIPAKGLDDKGNLVDNRTFKSIETLLSQLVLGQTIVNIDGKLVDSTFGDVRNNTVVSAQKIEATRISVASAKGETQELQGCITGVFKTITPEIKNEEETGRGLATILTFTSKGEAIPFKFVAHSYEELTDMWQVGDSAKVSFTVEERWVGSKPQAQSTRKTFGKVAQFKSVEGKSITEYIITGGEEAYENEGQPLEGEAPTEAQKYFVTKKEVEEGLNSRAVTEQRILQQAIDRANGTKATTTTPVAKSETKVDANPFGAPATPVVEAPKTEAPTALF